MVDAEPVVAMVNGEEVTATPTATGITTPGFTSTASGHYMVTAGQPIVHNTTIYQTIPTADPSAVVRALQRWTRSNGSLPITRGRG